MAPHLNTGKFIMASGQAKVQSTARLSYRAIHKAPKNCISFNRTPKGLQYCIDKKQGALQGAPWDYWAPLQGAQ